MPLKRRLVLIASPYSLVDPPALYEPGRLDHTPSVNHDSRVFSPIYFCCIPCDTTYTKESASVVSNALLDTTVVTQHQMMGFTEIKIPVVQIVVVRNVFRVIIVDSLQAAVHTISQSQ